MKARALVLEDDLSMHPILGTALQSICPGIEVEWVRNAEDALQRIKLTISKAEPSYDLILVDVFLDGELTGLEFWKACKVLCPEIPLVIVTAMPIEYFKKSLGMKEDSLPPRIGKPIRVEECRRVIAPLLP